MDVALRWRERLTDGCFVVASVLIYFLGLWVIKSMCVYTIPGSSLVLFVSND